MREQSLWKGEMTVTAFSQTQHSKARRAGREGCWTLSIQGAGREGGTPVSHEAWVQR